MSVEQQSNNNTNGLEQLGRSTENAKRIKSVQDKFVNSQNLQRDGRALVGEGVLIKVCRKKPKQRVFFLFNDILVYGRIVIGGRKYTQQKIIPLNEIQIVESSDPIENPYGWVIRSPKKSFTVRANSDRERQEWLTHLERCIRHTKGDNNGFQDTPEPWVPDIKAEICMHCNSTKFSPYNRRHHCRKCGIIVCDNCSKKRHLIVPLRSKPVRVCDTCFTKLNENQPINDSRTNQRDSSESDGEENTQQESPTPATFYSDNTTNDE